MKRWPTVMLLVAGLLLCSPAQTAAHHPIGSIYDLGQTTTVEGKLLEASIRNPHSFLTIEVTGKDGKKTVWGGEWGTVSAMSQIGVGRSTFKAGDIIVVIGNPPINRNSGPAGMGERLLIRSVIRPADGLRWNLQTK